jgi:hypothetical protein
LIFSKIPHVEFWATRVRIPDLQLGFADHPTRIHDLKVAGEKLRMDPLMTRILVDEQLNVYNELYTWMYNISVNGLASDSFSDCIVEIGNRKWQFNDVMPVNISSFEMDGAQASSSPVQLDATFVYNNFVFQ